MTEIILADGTSWEKIYFLETPTFHDKTFWVTSMLRRYKAMRSELDEQDQISLDQWLDKYNVFPGILITIQCGGNFEYFWENLMRITEDSKVPNLQDLFKIAHCHFEKVFQTGNCCICQDAGVREQTFCGHFVHKDCISKWAKKNIICPQCKSIF